MPERQWLEHKLFSVHDIVFEAGVLIRMPFVAFSRPADENAALKTTWAQKSCARTVVFRLCRVC
jgi:hypothetical protein